MIHETDIKVRYAETDQMGVVHHSNYFHWFEVGRTEFLDSLGMTYSQVEQEGIFMPLIESHCKYIIGAKYEDKLIIRTKITEIKHARVWFSYEVIRIKDNNLLAEGSTVHAFTGTNFKPLNLKKQNIKLYDIFISCIE